MKTQGRLTVLCRMETVNLETSEICQLFREYGLSLDTLGIDLLNIIKSPNNEISKELYVQALVYDIYDMIEMTTSELDPEDVIDSFSILFQEVYYQIGCINVTDGRLVNIQLDNIDTLILEFIK